MQPLAAIAVVVLVLVASIPSGPRALASAASTEICIGAVFQLNEAGTKLTAVSAERLKGLQLLQSYANDQASDPFRLTDGSRITVRLDVRNYTYQDSSAMASVYYAMTRDVDMFLGPSALATYSTSTIRALEALRWSQKVVIIDAPHIPGDGVTGSDRYPYAFFTGLDASSIMLDGLQKVRTAWANTTAATQQPTLVVATGCANLRDCSIPAYLCRSAERAGQALGYTLLEKFTFEDANMPRVIQKMKVLNVDVAAFCVNSDSRAVNVVVTSRALGFTPKALIMDHITQGAVVDAVGASNANYLLSPVAWDPRQSGTCRIFGSPSGFDQAFKQRFGYSANVYAVNGAAAGLALLAGVENVGRWPLSGQELSQGLHNLNLDSFYRKLAFGPNRTLLDAFTYTAQVQPLAASLPQAERYTRSDVKFLQSGEVPLFPMPSWQDKALEVFPCQAGLILDPKQDNLTCVGCPAGTQRPSTELECRTCPIGYFNSNPGQASCVACPLGADCTQDSNSILPPSEAGFYLLPNFKNGQPYYKACVRKVCAGANQCIGGNSGVLCSDCKPGYTNTGLSLEGKTNICEECPDMVKGIAKTLVVVLYLGFAFGILMHMTVAASLSVRAIHIVLLKIFANYIHMFCTVSNFSWLGRLPVVSFIMDLHLAPFSSLSSTDCLIKNFSMREYQVQTLSGLVMVPAILVIIYMIHKVCFYWELRRISQHAYRYVDTGGGSAEPAAASTVRKTSVSGGAQAQTERGLQGQPDKTSADGAVSTPRRTLQSRREQAFQDMLISRSRWAIVVIFFLYPAMVRKLVLVLECRELDVMRLSFDQDVQCLVGDHIFWLIAGALGLVVYGLGIPVFLFVKLHGIKDRLTESRERQVYGFLFNGFQPQYYYFEAVYMVRKMAFLLLGCVPSPTTRTLVMFILTCGFLGIQIRCQPYDNRDFFALDRLETSCLLALLITLAILMMYHHGDSEENSHLVDYWKGRGDVFVWLTVSVIAVVHAYCWVLMLWSLMRNSIMKYTHFKGECVPNSLSRFGRIMLKFEPNMNLVDYHPETHRMDLKQLTRRERKFLMRALCDTMEWYIQGATQFHPGRVATCLRLAIELCIKDRKQRARDLVARLSKTRKQGVRGFIQHVCSEVKSAWSLHGRIKAHESSDDDLALGRKKLPKGAKALMREAVLKVSGHTAMIEELQNALMLCERHIIIGKGSGMYYDIDKPKGDFRQQGDEDDESKKNGATSENEGEEDSKWRVNTTTLFGAMTRANTYKQDDDEEEHAPQDVRVQMGREDDISQTVTEVGLDTKALRKRQADLASEAQELQKQADKLQRQLRLTKEPEKATAPVSPPAQLPQGNGVRERHLVRSVTEDDLKEDLKALKTVDQPAEAEPANKDMEDFLASLMEEKVGKYWRYTPVNGASIAIRAIPTLDGPDSGNTLKPGSTFRVCEEKKGDNGILFLKLADGRGWVFDRKPGVGIMCVKEGG